MPGLPGEPPPTTARLEGAGLSNRATATNLPRMNAGAAGAPQAALSRALNGICPYYTMFPLDFPMRVLSRVDRPGGWVLDPFCGRGTTNFAARVLGLPNVGFDSNPVAIAIAAAKLTTVHPKQV